MARNKRGHTTRWNKKTAPKHIHCIRGKVKKPKRLKGAAPTMRISIHGVMYTCFGQNFYPLENGSQK